MKIRITLQSVSVLVCLFFTVIAKGQLASGIPFTFSTALTPPAFPVAGTTNILMTAANQNEYDTLIAPAGFNFIFCGKTYTKIVLSTNGWMALCPNSVSSIPPSIPDAMPLNSLSTNSTGFPLIAPLWDDLSSNLISLNFTNNALWIRWTIRWNYQSPTAASSLMYLKLDCINNSITFYYPNNTTYIPTSPSASIGIAGECPGDFYSVNTTSPTAAYIDSVIENTNIGQNGANDMRPYNCQMTFTPNCRNDNCASATQLGNIYTNCVPYFSSTYNATASGIPGNCGTSDVKDVWFSVIKPIGIADVSVETSPDSCRSVSGTSLEIYDSCGGNLLGCAITSIAYPNFANVTVAGNYSIAETLYVRITADNDAEGKFNICIKGQTATSANESDAADVNVYFSGKILHINSSSNAKGEFKLINPAGALVLQGSLTEERSPIDCEFLSEGIYFLITEINGIRSVTKLLLTNN
jgi:hypothetical protein